MTPWHVDPEKRGIRRHVYHEDRSPERRITAIIEVGPVDDDGRRRDSLALQVAARPQRPRSHTMKERPILFQDRLVRAILEDRKNQTRRVFRWPKDALDARGLPGLTLRPHACDLSPTGWSLMAPLAHEVGNCRDSTLQCPYGAPGDVLWVREAWAPGPDAGDGVPYLHRATWTETQAPRWRPSIHMPREACRLRLEVADVCVERLQAITEEDAIAEGVQSRQSLGFGAIGYHGHGTAHMTAKQAFASLWDSINAGRGYGWQTNPWVWAITFRRLP